MRTLRNHVLVLLGVVMPLSLTACASSSEAGFGLPVLAAADAAEAIASGSEQLRAQAGVLAVEQNGCFTWRTDDATEADSAWIVWPEGSKQDGGDVVLSSGARVGDGDALDAVGALVALADLPDGANADSYFAGFGHFCGADERGVLVLTEVSTG